MDTELVKLILKNRNENKLKSKEELQEEIKYKVVDIYGEFIDFEPNKENVYETLEKLEKYRYCENVSELKKGDYIRFLNTKHFYDIKLNKGGFIENINGNLINIVSGNKFYRIKFDNNTIFIKLTDEDLLKLELLEILEKN